MYKQQNLFIVETSDANPEAVMKSKGLLLPGSLPLRYSMSMAVDGYAAPMISLCTFPAPAKNSTYSNSCSNCRGLGLWQRIPT